MRTIEKTVFQFHELCESAKETARDWYRNASAGDNYFSESVIEDACHIADIIGIDIDTHPVKLMSGKTRQEPSLYWSGFHSQGDGASFTGSYSYKKGALKALKAYAPLDRELQRICSELQAAQKRVFYSASANITTRGHYQHSGCMYVSVDMRDDIKKVVFSDTEETVETCVRDFANWIYAQLEKEYEYQNSDAQVDESIEANGYEFYESGERA